VPSFDRSVANQGFCDDVIKLVSKSVPPFHRLFLLSLFFFSYPPFHLPCPSCSPFTHVASSIRYVLPVIRMTSCFHTTGPMGRVKHDVVFRRVSRWRHQLDVKRTTGFGRVHQNVAPGEVCYLQLPCSLFLFRPGRVAEYCDECVCLSVCLSARIGLCQVPQIRTLPHFLCMLPKAVARSSIWLFCNTFCISGFVNDVTFSYNGPRCNGMLTSLLHGFGCVLS